MRTLNRKKLAGHADGLLTVLLVVLVVCYIPSLMVAGLLLSTLIGREILRKKFPHVLKERLL